MPVRQNKEKNHHSRFHSDSQYRLLLFFFKFIGSDPKLPTTIEITYVPTPNIFRTWLSQNNDTFKLSNHSFLSLLHKIMIISHFRISHNATYLFPPHPLPKKKILHNLCSSFLLGITAVQREIQNNAYAKFWGANKVHYGKCESGVWLLLRLLLWSSWLYQWREDLTSWLPPSAHKLCLSSIIRLGLEDNKTFLSDARQPKVVFFHFWTVILSKF